MFPTSMPGMVAQALPLSRTRILATGIAADRGPFAFGEQSEMRDLLGGMASRANKLKHAWLRSKLAAFGRFDGIRHVLGCGC